MDFVVRLSPEEAVKKVVSHITNHSVSSELIDHYHSGCDDYMLDVLVFEKFFMRNSSRASLTVTIENFKERTTVHAVGSGGGQGSLFKFDWGASDSFIEEVKIALRDDIY